MKNHTIIRWLRRILLSLGLALAGTAQAQYTSDIDIYSASGSSDIPNVLFVIDNTANWNQAFTNEMAALVSAFNSLPVDRFRVGLMFFNKNTPGDQNNNQGGYVRSAIRTLDENYRSRLTALLRSLAGR